MRQRYKAALHDPTGASPKSVGLCGLAAQLSLSSGPAGGLLSAMGTPLLAWTPQAALG